MKEQLYSSQFIQFPQPIKEYIAKKFDIPKRGNTHVIDNVVRADGYLDEDLAKVNLTSLQVYLHSMDTNFYSLMNTLLKEAEQATRPEVVVVSPAKPGINVSINIDGEKVTVSQDEKVVEQPKKTYVRKTKATPQV